jgi:hypothetical protein
VVSRQVAQFAEHRLLSANQHSIVEHHFFSIWSNRSNGHCSMRIRTPSVHNRLYMQISEKEQPRKALLRKRYPISQASQGPNANLSFLRAYMQTPKSSTHTCYFSTSDASPNVSPASRDSNSSAPNTPPSLKFPTRYLLVDITFQLVWVARD